MKGGTPDRSQASPVQSPGWSLRTWSKWLGLVPFLVFFALLVFVQPLNEFVFESLTLDNILRTVLVSLTGFVVAYAAARAFLSTRLVPLLWLGAGILILATTVLAGTWLPPGNGRTMIAATGILLAAVAQLPAGVQWHRRITSKARGVARTYLSIVYGSGILLLLVIFFLSASGAIPPVPRTNLATFRISVSLTAGILYTFVAFYLLWRYIESRSSFLYWYSLGLLFLALMQIMVAISNITGAGSIGSWITRGALYLSGLYPLIAVLTAMREARIRHVPVAEVMADFFRQTRESYQRAAAASSDAIAITSRLSAAKWVGMALPLILILLLLLVRTIDTGFVYYPALLFSVFNIVFVVLISLVVAYQAARGYLTTGQSQLAWLGGGALVFGFSGLLSAIAQTQLNAAVTLHNIGAFISGIIYTVGAVVGMSEDSILHQTKARAYFLTAIYATGAALILLIMVLSLAGMTPTFFVPGTGGTPLRQVVVYSATALFGISGIILLSLLQNSFEPAGDWR